MEIRSSTISWAVKIGSVIIPEPEGREREWTEEMGMQLVQDELWNIYALASSFSFSAFSCLCSPLAQTSRLLGGAASCRWCLLAILPSREQSAEGWRADLQWYLDSDSTFSVHHPSRTPSSFYGSRRPREWSISRHQSQIAEHPALDSDKGLGTY